LFLLLLQELSVPLRTEVSLFLYEDIVRKVPYFRDADRSFIALLVEYFHPLWYGPGMFVVREGDVGSEMFFMAKGHVEVLGKNGEVLSELKEGSFFGEIALLMESKRTASIRTKTFCSIYTLSKADLDKSLALFPEQKKSLVYQLFHFLLFFFFVFLTQYSLSVMLELAQIRIIYDSLRILLPKLRVHPPLLLIFSSFIHSFLILMQVFSDCDPSFLKEFSNKFVDLLSFFLRSRI
jgi:CRP-like cAMP-binding protein